MSGRTLLALVVLAAASAGSAAGRELNEGGVVDREAGVGGMVWAACGAVVCPRVEAEAEGLIRIKLIKGYVTETVRLLNTLMTSLDREVGAVAAGMKKFVGPHCQSSHALLQHVMQPLMDGAGYDLSTGIMAESSTQARSEEALLASGIEPSTPSRPSGPPHRNTWSPSYGSRTQNTGRQMQDGSLASSSSSSYSDRQGYASGGNDIYNNINSPENDDEWPSISQASDNWMSSGQESSSYDSLGANADTEQWWSSNDNSGGNRGSRGRWTGNNNDRDDTHSSSWRPIAGTGRQTFSNKRPSSNNSGGRYSSTHGRDRNVVEQSGSRCRGLPGSAFTVPGLDDWCEQNCAKGYCPPTHCTCD